MLLEKKILVDVTTALARTLSKSFHLQRSNTPEFSSELHPGPGLSYTAVAPEVTLRIPFAAVNHPILWALSFHVDGKVRK